MSVLHQILQPQAEESNMVARPSMPQQVQPAPPVQHAQFRQDPSMLDTAKSALAGQVINKGTAAATNYLFPTAATAAAPAAAGTAGALGAAAAPAAASALGAGATGAAAAGGLGGALGGLGGALGGAGAGLMAAAAPVAVPLAIGAGLGKLFGLFNEGGRVPTETMTAISTQTPQPQPQAPTQMGGPLSFKQAEQQQKLAIKQATFDAEQRRKDEAHQMKMMQQQIKLTEAASGLRAPLSAR